jgi:hypothetical protein
MENENDEILLSEIVDIPPRYLVKCDVDDCLNCADIRNQPPPYFCGMHLKMFKDIMTHFEFVNLSRNEPWTFFFVVLVAWIVRWSRIISGVFFAVAVLTGVFMNYYLPAAIAIILGVVLLYARIALLEKAANK